MIMKSKIIIVVSWQLKSNNDEDSNNNNGDGSEFNEKPVSGLPPPTEENSE